MTADTPWTPPGRDGGVTDIIGDRVLVGIQMVDISRLSTHPVPFTTQGLITVAGQGPKDSNGAGKSSFIAALSLLHADEQWRLTVGAAAAAELLFTAELAAQETRWSNADHGYIIGVFAAPEAVTVEDLGASAVTVWLRINRKAPYIDLRWAHRLHVPHGASDEERACRVDALWDALSKSHGRTDFHAGSLARVLYGDSVRCVSFLSTSVRASPTANLLAQPLNDLSPERIFDAIATLTGLDRELEHEQALRSTEHTHRSSVKEAEVGVEEWEREVAIVETGIAQRGRARERLGAAQTAWHGRCARHLIDGVERIGEIRADIAQLEQDEKELQGKLTGTDSELRALKDDTEFAQRFKDRERQHATVTGRDRDLERAHDKASGRIEDLAKTHRRLIEQATAADGRGLDEAQAEEREAHQIWEGTLKAKGAAEATDAQARQRLAAAESGEDLAVDQMLRLRKATIPAAALLDVVQLDEAARAEWEPRLIPYRTAVVVHADHSTKAQDALSDLPGSILILADLPEASGSAGLPASADPRFTVSGFLGALSRRAGGDPEHIDLAAGIRVIGGFDEPVTGRATRITAARGAVDQASDALNAAEQEVTRTERLLTRAKARTVAAVAADDAAETQERIDQLRLENKKTEDQRELLKPDLIAAQRSYNEAVAEQNTRQHLIESLTRDKKRFTAETEAKGVLTIKLGDERDALDLAGRQTAWGETTQAATAYLLSLTDHEQERRTGAWNEEACHQIQEVVRLCFPDDTPAEHMTAEIRELLLEQRWQRGGLDNRVRLAAPLLRALHSHLTESEKQDTYQQVQISEQRTQRTKDLAVGRQGLTEAAHASNVHRSSLAAGIKAKLKQVADEFDRLDQKYGGYGAGLDYPEPEPPSQPDKPWRWSVTPKWRRAEGQRTASYRLRANTAQMDEKAVKLVCASALAGGGGRPLLLVLDELGRNLGSEHRREAVALFEQIGQDRNITVVGALQDDMERYAINASGLFIKLRRSSDALPYNEAPVVNGSEANHARVELLRDWLSVFRPTPDGGGDD